MSPNCEFRNNQDDNPQNPGFAWIDPGTYPCDTAKFYNNTFFLTGGYILGSSGYGATFLDFQHNTIFFSGQGGAFDLYQMHNAVIKNNIFYSVSSAAYPEGWYANTPGSWGSSIIPLDSLRSLAAAPYNMTEASRRITIIQQCILLAATDRVQVDGAQYRGDLGNHASPPAGFHQLPAGDADEQDRVAPHQRGKQ